MGKDLLASKSKSPVKAITSKAKPASGKEATSSKAVKRSVSAPKSKIKATQKPQAAPDRKRDEKASRKKAEQGQKLKKTMTERSNSKSPPKLKVLLDQKP